MLRHDRLRLAVLALFLLICMAQAAAASPASAGRRAEQAFVRGAPAPAWILPAPPLPAPVDAPFSVRLNDVQLRVDAQPATYVHRALVARDIGSLDNVANLELSFQPDYEVLQLHRLRVHRAGRIEDRLDDADVRFLQRERGLEQGIYSGRVTVAIVLPDLRVGDTLEIEYTTVGANPVFEGRYMEAAQWDAPFPVAWRRVVLDTPEGRPVGHRLVGAAAGTAPAISEQLRGGRRLQVFEGRNLPALLGDPGTPRDVQGARWLQFSEYASWSEVNAWALRLFQAGASGKAFEAALAPARAARTPEQAAVRALEFVQNEIRYLSLSLGENSHRPALPAEVLARRYGDCKDKSLLLVTMLRALGLEADPVLVPVALHKNLGQYLPSPMLFDHAIVRLKLDGRSWFLDPTRQGQHGQLARMGQPLAGADVLVAHAGAAALEAIPYPAEPERQRRSEQVSLAAMDAPATLVVRSEYTGAGAEALRASFAMATQAELRKSVEGAMARRYPEAQLSGDVTLQDDRERNVAVIESRFTVPNMFSESAEGWSVDYSAVNMADLLLPPEGARRSAPLAVPGYPYAVDYEMALLLPDSFALREDSHGKKVDDPAFAGTRTIATAKRNLGLKLHLDVRADRVEAARALEFGRKLQSWDTLRSGSLKVFKSDLRTAQQEQGPPSEEARLRAALAGLDLAVLDAERTGREPGRALCERARVRAHLGQANEAIKDALKAVKLQEQDNDLLACRAEVQLLAGRARAAEADYTRMIARGQAEPATYFQRGLANLYLNRNAQAAADFREAQRGLDEGERLNAAVMGASLGATVTPAPPEDGDNAWLPVALEMFAGKVTPEHLVSEAMRGPRAGADARLSAAYYFAGRYLQQKNPLKARAFFQRASDKRALASIYYHLARIELGRPQP